ncbi:hypothetical protein Ancab_017150 [Ancistrocladus abbreviatus]
MIKTLFSPDGGSHDGKSDKGSIPVVQAAEKVSVTGKGSTGSVVGGKQWSKSGEFVAGDGGINCNIYEAGQEFCLDELKGPLSSPISTRCKAQQVENAGQSPEIMGRSPASFKEDSNHGVRESRELSSTMKYLIVAAGSKERERQAEYGAEVVGEPQRTARGHNARKKSLEEIFSATPIICRSDWHHRKFWRNLADLVLPLMKKHQVNSPFTGTSDNAMDGKGEGVFLDANVRAIEFFWWC